MMKKVLLVVGGFVLGCVAMKIRNPVVTVYTPVTVTQASGAIGKAKIAGIEAEAARLRHKLGREEFGLDCREYEGLICDDLIDRAEKNLLLKSALLKAKAMAKATDVAIHLECLFRDDGGYVHPGYVTLNGCSRDKDIIAFLTK